MMCRRSGYLPGRRWSYVREGRRNNMCGITGWVDFSRDLTREGALIDAMTATMACRGLEASGVWSEPNAALGTRRLAVIDVPGGAQPMSVSTPNGDVVI